jgi:hypothetical protein
VRKQAHLARLPHERIVIDELEGGLVRVTLIKGPLTSVFPIREDFETCLIEATTRGFVMTDRR